MKDDVILMIGAGLAVYLLTRNADKKVDANVPDTTQTVSPAGETKTVNTVTSNVFGTITKQTTDIVRQITTSDGSKKVISYNAPLPSYQGAASYDVVSGTGFNSAGYGYSSAYDLGSKGTGTGIVPVKTATTNIFAKVF